jgi:phospholipid/cholesterol/gamma-HCH transport system ATP-binding protein
MVSSDIDRLLTVTDRVGMLYKGTLDLRRDHRGGEGLGAPVVRQFIHGEVEGPL